MDCGKLSIKLPQKLYSVQKDLFGKPLPLQRGDYVWHSSIFKALDLADDKQNDFLVGIDVFACLKARETCQFIEESGGFRLKGEVKNCIIAKIRLDILSNDIFSQTIPKMLDEVPQPSFVNGEVLINITTGQGSFPKYLDAIPNPKNIGLDRKVITGQLIAVSSMANSVTVKDKIVVLSDQNTLLSEAAGILEKAGAAAILFTSSAGANAKAKPVVVPKAGGRGAPVPSWMIEQMNDQPPSLQSPRSQFEEKVRVRIPAFLLSNKDISEIQLINMISTYKDKSECSLLVGDPLQPQWKQQAEDEYDYEYADSDVPRVSAKSSGPVVWNEQPSNKNNGGGSSKKKEKALTELEAVRELYKYIKDLGGQCNSGAFGNLFMKRPAVKNAIPSSGVKTLLSRYPDSFRDTGKNGWMINKSKPPGGSAPGSAKASPKTQSTVKLPPPPAHAKVATLQQPAASAGGRGRPIPAWQTEAEPSIPSLSAKPKIATTNLFDRAVNASQPQSRAFVFSSAGDRNAAVTLFGFVHGYGGYISHSEWPTFKEEHKDAYSKIGANIPAFVEKFPSMFQISGRPEEWILRSKEIKQARFTESEGREVVRVAASNRRSAAEVPLSDGSFASSL